MLEWRDCRCVAFAQRKDDDGKQTRVVLAWQMDGGESSGGHPLSGQERQGLSSPACMCSTWRGCWITHRLRHCQSYYHRGITNIPKRELYMMPIDGLIDSKRPSGASRRLQAPLEAHWCPQIACEELSRHLELLHFIILSPQSPALTLLN